MEKMKSLTGLRRVQLIVAVIIGAKVIILAMNTLRVGPTLACQPRNLIAMAIPIGLFLWLYLSGSKWARYIAVAYCVLMIFSFVSHLAIASNGPGIWLPGFVFEAALSIVYLMAAHQLLWSPDVATFLEEKCKLQC